MEKGFLDRVEDNAAVQVWSERTQQGKGDSLTEGYKSELWDFTRISVTQNDLQELTDIWSSWNNEVKQLFCCNYGDLPYLLDVKVDKYLFRALAQFWNPAYSCFTFGGVDLVPTVEEYTALLNCPKIQVDRAYSRPVNVSTFLKKLMKATGMSEQWVSARIKQKGDSKCIPWRNLRDLILAHPDMKKRVDIFALSLYGLIIFPKALGHIDEAVSDLFDRLDKGTTPLLLAWFHSHFWKVEKVSYRVFSKDYSPLKELVATSRRDDTSGLSIHQINICKGYTLLSVLVDNGSALNVLPLSTLNRLPIDSSHMKTCHNVVRVFDGTERKVMGRINIPLEIGPNTYEVDFLVMDIKPSYNCLLGRPWIHSAGAVPSSLYQKLKLVTDGRLITINANEDIIATATSKPPYVETNEEAIECSFRSLEIVNATFISEGSKVPVPRMFGATRMALQMMMGKGASPGKGLGKQLQGGIQIPKLTEKKDRFGLGFKPDHKHKRQEMEKRQARRKVRLNGGEVEWKPMTFPPISKTFKSRWLLVEESHQINVVYSEWLGQENLEGIRPYEPGSSLNNWTAEDLPVVFRNFSESLDINDMSANTAAPDFSCEQDMCLEEHQDFEDVQDCDVSLDLLRMVKQEEKQIMPHEKEAIENIALEEGKEDMPGLSTDIVVHRLPIRQECKSFQQKLQRMRPDIILKIKDEVKKQFDARFLQEVKYSEWVANIVPVPKKDGKVRMCVDYRDLNKASPKDNFSLPHIDTLVDNTAGYSLFSFMDGFSGYNQIKMHLEDMDKTTFITLWGTFYYKVIPFGLKNAGATYQRAMVNLFHDMMHKDIEVYVDDMIAKSQTEKEHIEVLRKLFLRLRKFQLKLNPAKCTFGARSGKLLGFVVSEKGIEVDSDKVRAIRELPLPRTQKEVRGFLGRLNYIARFISQLTEKCDPIFHLLRKHNQGTWDEECQNAFEKVKQYLLNAPVLSPPSPDKPLILYLSVFNNSMGYMFGQHDESGKRKRAIYYLSKKFTDCEMRYSPIEKLCCALIGPHGEFDIIYVSQKAIKGSVVADFLASRALEDYEPLNFDFPNEELMCIAATEDSPWKLNFDGAFNAVENEIGAVLVSLNGDHYPFTCKLDFDCTNNMAEYEACIMGLQAAIERGIKTLEVYGDFALVIYQLRGE
ncbi:hypothetical protein CXB51_015340 [Gossypium anomalum]|uniref:G-patch domain-containing protein n=1 Tax=Gossypium anomalum TaxID=47600 RepID=A0A8J5Z1A5_9ROSI|nr:hypothetical protein CXB51_015340 [Gossypium anomalum]